MYSYPFCNSAFWLENLNHFHLKWLVIRMTSAILLFVFCMSYTFFVCLFLMSYITAFLDVMICLIFLTIYIFARKCGIQGIRKRSLSRQSVVPSASAWHVQPLAGGVGCHYSSGAVINYPFQWEFLMINNINSYCLASVRLDFYT